MFRKNQSSVPSNLYDDAPTSVSSNTGVISSENYTDPLTIYIDGDSDNTLGECIQHIQGQWDDRAETIYVYVVKGNTLPSKFDWKSLYDYINSLGTGIVMVFRGYMNLAMSSVMDYPNFEVCISKDLTFYSSSDDVLMYLGSRTTQLRPATVGGLVELASGSIERDGHSVLEMLEIFKYKKY